MTPPWQQAQGRQIREGLFFELALEDITRPRLFPSIYDRTCVDGWVSLESPLLLLMTPKTTLAEPEDLHARGERPNF